MERMWQMLGAIGLAVVMAGCGGGGGGDADGVTAPTGVATLGVDGGKVVAATAQVIVPPGAMATNTTIRIAADSTGAPPLPSWAKAVGTMLQITPHGNSFAAPVTVRMPAPQVTVAADERLLMAKAQPGGTWEVLGETQLIDGQLEAKVISFSYFTPVLVKFVQAPNTSFLPFGMSPLTFTCNGGPCPSPVVPTSTEVTVSSSGNGGRLPADCLSPTIELRHRGARVLSLPATPTVVINQALPWDRLNPDYVYSEASDGTVLLQQYLVCIDPLSAQPGAIELSSNSIRVDRFSTGPTTPQVRQFPTSLTLAPGATLTLTVVLTGGGSRLLTTDPIFVGPQITDVAVANLERLVPGDSVWRFVASKGEIEADPRPTGAPAWAYWGVSFALGPVALADSGTRYRIRACYRSTDRPDVPESCNIGPVATLTVVQQTIAPTFLQQPASVTVSAGQTASFTVQASGVPAPTLQWQARAAGASAWSDVAGATGATYTTAALQVADNGAQLRVVATNSAGSKESDVIALSVSAGAVAPTISSQPMSLTVTAGNEALFAVSAQGTAALSYQWLRNGIEIAGANGAQLKLSLVASADAGTYAVRVSNSVGSAMSANATLTVSPTPTSAPVAPTIVTQPAAVAVNEGNVATFAVGVTGSGPMTFQWRRNATPIAGATAAAYTIPAVAATDAGNYSVVVANAAGSVTSQEATLALVPAVGSAVAPSITTQPVSVVVVPRSTTTLAVSASGSGPLTYQWFKDGSPVAGANGPTLSFGSLDAVFNGSYTVTVSNAVGSVTSAPAQLLVVGAPQITVQPQATSATAGATATFTVQASGELLGYQWLRNGVAIAGAVNASFTTDPLVLADSGIVYSVVVYNGAGIVFSSGAVLTVSAPSAAAAWRAPTTLLANGSSFQPSAGIDDSGRAHAVWHTGNRTYASIGTATGGWSAAAPIDGGLLLNGYESRLAVSSGGRAVAVWGYQAGSAYRLAAAVFNGTAWQPPQRIDDTLSGNSQSARVAIDASGRAVVVWAQATTSGYIVMGRYFNGSAWSIPAPLDPGVTGGSPAVALSAAGQGFVVFKRDNGELLAMAVDAASGFGSATTLRAAGGSSGMLRVAVDGAGSAWAIWIDSATSGYDLIARRFTTGSGWAAPVTLATNVGFPLDDRFTVAGGDGGHLLVAWTNSITTAGRDTIYGLRFKPGVGWSAIDTLSTPGRDYAKLPNATVDVSGRMSFVWAQADATNSRAEVVARYFDGSAWGTPVPLQASTLDIANTDQIGTGIAADGTAVAVWVEYAASGTEPVLGAFRR